MVIRVASENSQADSQQIDESRIFVVFKVYFPCLKMTRVELTRTNSVCNQVLKTSFIQNLRKENSKFSKILYILNSLVPRTPYKVKLESQDLLYS